MKFCNDHWIELAQEVKNAGLWQLVSPSGYEAIRRLEAGEFDPLFHAHNLLMCTALSHAGRWILKARKDGSKYCPVCYLSEEVSSNSMWLKTAVEYSQEEALEKGLLYLH